MDRTAQPEYDVLDLIRRRFSPRAFQKKPLTNGELSSLLEAARWSSSCFNEQPWRFIVARREEEEIFGRLLSCLSERNQSWAGGAAALMLSVASTTFAHNGKPNRHAWHDVGLAMGQLGLQATALGLSIHQMAGFDPDRARAQFAIPLDFEPVALCALGTAGDPDVLPAQLAEKERAPRERRRQQEFVFGGTWGQPRSTND